MSAWQEDVTWASTEAARWWPLLLPLAAGVAAWARPRVRVWQARRRMERTAALVAIVQQTLDPIARGVAEVERLTGENHHANPDRPTVPDRLDDVLTAVELEARARRAADTAVHKRLDVVTSLIADQAQTGADRSARVDERLSVLEAAASVVALNAVTPPPH